MLPTYPALPVFGYLATSAALESLLTLGSSPAAADVPLVVEYVMADLGHLRFYLAPKIEDEA